MSIVILGIDLGKNLCSVVGLDEAGAVVLRRSMRRQTVLGFAAKLPACVVAMEACCGAHHLGRWLTAQGHTVKLMSPEYVRPYVKAPKNDNRDAEAIAEAASRPTMRFVDLKSQEQLDLQTLHRLRSRLVAARRTLLNQLRAILFERGHAFPAGRRRRPIGFGQEALDPCGVERAANSSGRGGVRESSQTERSGNNGKQGPHRRDQRRYGKRKADALHEA